MIRLAGLALVPAAAPQPAQSGIAQLAAWLVRGVADAGERPAWDPAAQAELRLRP